MDKARPIARHPSFHARAPGSAGVRQGNQRIN